MAIVEENNQPWEREHDDPGVPVVPSAPRILYPQTLEDLIALCANIPPSQKIHASGSHWSLSEAAISDHIFLETTDTRSRQRMNRTLYDVVPGALNPDFVDELAAKRVPAFEGTVRDDSDTFIYPYHIEAGKRVFELYSELDFGDDHPVSLAKDLAENRENITYLSPWALPTMGNSGGQTVFGALTTGTHGADFKLPPIADAVLAIHLVAHGGDHWWIEPEGNVPGFSNPLTTESAVQSVLDVQDTQFRFRRDDDLFNAVLVSAGRFGIVYSFVVGAVPQYSLRERRTLRNWSDVKNLINDDLQSGSLYTHQTDLGGPKLPNRGLQIAINPTPHAGGNRVGVTERRLDGGTTAGRAERRGDRLPFDPEFAAPEFERAGKEHSYSPPDAPGDAADPSFLEQACANGDFLIGVIEMVLEEIINFVRSDGAIVGATLIQLFVPGGGALVATLVVTLASVNDKGAMTCKC